ncbi:MAG: sugar nucleotide-binding protein [Pseudomonadota bacterium]
MTSRVLVLGSSGLLGHAFMRALGSKATAVSRQDLDGAATKLPKDDDIVINCIAHTQVEAAEDEIEQSFYANAFLPGCLAAAAARNHQRFVHFSSTGCYGTGQSDPWNDYAEPVPTTQHHKSKLAGELEVRHAHPAPLLLRIGWLYGQPPEGRRDFVEMIAAQARSTDQIYSDPSQTGNPTCVDEVVLQTMHLLAQDVSGTYNCVARGAARRIDYVREIVQSLNLDTEVVPAPEGHFKRRAAVSPNEAAVNMKLHFCNNLVMSEWDAALRRNIAERNI